MSGISTHCPVALIQAGRGMDIETYPTIYDMVTRLINSGHLAGKGGWGGPDHRDALLRLREDLDATLEGVNKQIAKDAEFP